MPLLRLKRQRKLWSICGVASRYVFYSGNRTYLVYGTTCVPATTINTVTTYRCCCCTRSLGGRWQRWPNISYLSLPQSTLQVFATDRSNGMRPCRGRVYQRGCKYKFERVESTIHHGLLTCTARVPFAVEAPRSLLCCSMWKHYFLPLPTPNSQRSLLMPYFVLSGVLRATAARTQCPSSCF